MDAKPTKKLKGTHQRIYVNFNLPNPNVFRAVGWLLNITPTST
jgi:hypothetical protein